MYNDIQNGTDEVINGMEGIQGHSLKKKDTRTFEMEQKE